MQMPRMTTGAQSQIQLVGGVTAATVYWVTASTLHLGSQSNFVGQALVGCERLRADSRDVRRADSVTLQLPPPLARTSSGTEPSSLSPLSPCEFCFFLRNFPTQTRRTVLTYLLKGYLRRHVEHQRGLR